MLVNPDIASGLSGYHMLTNKKGDAEKEKEKTTDFVMNV